MSFPEITKFDLFSVLMLFTQSDMSDAPDYEEIQKSWLDESVSANMMDRESHSYFNMATAIAPYKGGIAACIAGWTYFMVADEEELEKVSRETEFMITDYIKSLEGTALHTLFSPPKELLHVIRLEHAVKAIIQYLDKDTVDWSSIVTAP